MRRALLIVAMLAFASAAGAVEMTTENNASCDIGPYPAATLLLPHFEVDFNAPVTSAVNTVFTVVNTSRLPQVLRVTIWSDLGFPVSWFNMFLTGYDMHTVSMYEIIARGRFPMTTAQGQVGSSSAANSANPNILYEELCHPFGGAGNVPMPALKRLQNALSTGERDQPGCLIGTRHDNAIGYVTIDVINSCATDSPLSESYWNEVLLYDNVLTGDYIRINPEEERGNFSGANPLVHLRAIPEGGPAGSKAGVAFPYTFYDRYTPGAAKKSDRRQPLPSVFSARFIQGGPTGFQTNLMIWREGATNETQSQCDYAKNKALPIGKANVVRFDEHENATAIAADIPTALVASMPTSSPQFPSLSPAGDFGGWMWISLDHASRPRPSQGWITVQMYAEGRYAVDFDATWLSNGCSPAPAAP